MLITSPAKLLYRLDVQPSFIFSVPLLFALGAPAYLSPTGLVAQGLGVGEASPTASSCLLRLVCFRQEQTSRVIAKEGICSLRNLRVMG